MAVPDHELHINAPASVSSAAPAPAVQNIPAPRADNAGPEHFVLFYRDDQVLIDSLARYIRRGFDEGAAAVVIATEEHRAALQERLGADGVDTAQLGSDEQLILLDAEQTLESFMADGVPDRDTFFARVGGIIHAAARRHAHVLAFGEMVALLWKQGNTGASVALEGLWNELVSQQAFTLFCAYPMQECGGEQHIMPFEAVCGSHSRVLPVGEHYAALPVEQQRAIAQLQQKALVLEKKLAQEMEIQRAKQHLAAIVESSDDAIIGKTLDGVIQSWNAGAERLFGWSAAEAIGRSITLIIPAERLGEEQHILETLKRGERIDHFETTRQTRDGRPVEISLTVSPIRDAAGVVIGASKIARDISARRRNEELLRRQETALQQAHLELQSRMRELARFNEAAVGRELRVIELKQEVNALREQLGQSERYALKYEEERRAPVGLQAQARQRAKDAAPLESIVRTGQLFERPARPADDDSLDRAVNALVQALAESPGTILQSLAQETLALLRAGSAGLSLLSDDGERFSWPAIAGQWSPHRGGGTPRSFGPDGDVLECDGPLLFTHWEHRYPYLAATLPLAEESLVVPIQAGGKAVGTMWVIAHEAGRKFDAEDLRQLERLSRFAAAAYQATQHLALLEQRRAALNLLEDALQARELAEESNRRLRQTQEEQRESDRRKNEFLALLGHELRNPLTSISTASELLQRTVPERRARLAVEMIKRQTTQLTRLVDDLLDIGRITQGRMQLARKPIELSTVISQALETVEPQLRVKQHDIRVISSTPRPLYVDGDFVRLVQCVVNVLTNAAKYSDPHGSVRIEMRPEGPEAVIEIADNGTGIPPELLPKIFDLFVQNDHTLDRSQGGLGIGLSVVKRLIEMHGGHVSARSPGVGQGSTFEIRLPRIEQGETRRLGAAPFKGPCRRVLVVDDNVDAATSLAMLLNLQGHQAEAVYGARDALERTQSFRPEVALLDIGLPEMDGLSLARQLRAMPKPDDGLRLIALTGYAMPDDRQRALAAGFDDHLTKPVDMQTLERVMAGKSTQDD